MNDREGLARRYHWLGQNVSDFVCEPHSGISDLGSGGMAVRAVCGGHEGPGQPCCFTNKARTSRSREAKHGHAKGSVTMPPTLGVAGVPPASSLPLLNMVALEAGANREGSARLVRDDFKELLCRIESATLGGTLLLPRHHPVLPADVNLPRLERICRQAHERAPGDFETLLGLQGVGPATVRALSLLAELIYSAPASHRDPAVPPPENPPAQAPARRRYADYSYAHGGKDGFPFPVDRATYDRSIAVLTDALRKARLGETDKTAALRRLAEVVGKI